MFDFPTFTYIIVIAINMEPSSLKSSEGVANYSRPGDSYPPLQITEEKARSRCIEATLEIIAGTVETHTGVWRLIHS